MKRLRGRPQGGRDRGFVEVGVALAGALLVLGAVVGNGVAATVLDMTDGQTWLPDDDGRVVQVNPATGEPERRLVVGAEGSQMEVSQRDGHLIVADPATGELTAINLAGLVASGSRGADTETWVLIGGGQVVLVEPSPGTVRAVDPLTLTDLGTPYRTDDLAHAVIDDDGSVWALTTGGDLLELDFAPEAGSFVVTTERPVAGTGSASRLVPHGSGATVFGPDGGAIVQVGTGREIAVNVPALEGQVAPAERSDWDLVPASATDAGRVFLLTDGEVVDADVGSVGCDRPGAPAVLEERVYVPCLGAGRVIVLDRDGNRAGEDVVVPGGGDPTLVVDEGRLFVHTPNDDRIVLVQPDGSTQVVDIGGAEVPEQAADRMAPPRPPAGSPPPLPPPPGPGQIAAPPPPATQPQQTGQQDQSETEQREERSEERDRTDDAGDRSGRDRDAQDQRRDDGDRDDGDRDGEGRAPDADADDQSGGDDSDGESADGEQTDGDDGSPDGTDPDDADDAGGDDVDGDDPDGDAGDDDGSGSGDGSEDDADAGDGTGDGDGSGDGDGDGDGTGDGDDAGDTDPTPAAPTNLQARAQGDQIRVTWTAPEAQVQEYIVTASDGSVARTVAGDRTSVDVQVATCGADVNITVTAHFAGDAQRSASTTARVPDCPEPEAEPGPPTNVQAQAAGADQIRVTWTAPEVQPEEYVVTSSDGSAAETVTGTSTSADVTVATCETNLTMTVTAHFAGGAQESGSATVRAPDCPEPDPVEATAPSNVTAQALGGGQVRVTWTAASSGADTYIVHPSNGGATDAGTATSVVLDLAPGQYTFRVEAQLDGTSATSGASPQVTVAGPPGAPGSVSGSVTNQTLSAVTVRVNWSAAAANGSSISGYTVSLSGGGTQTVSGTQATFTINCSGQSLCHDGGTLTAQVTATNAEGNGPTASGTVTVPAANIPRNGDDVLRDSVRVDSQGGVITGSITYEPNSAWANFDGTCTVTVNGGPPQAIACSASTTVWSGSARIYEELQASVSVTAVGSGINATSSTWVHEGPHGWCDPQSGICYDPQSHRIDPDNPDVEITPMPWTPPEVPNPPVLIAGMGMLGAAALVRTLRRRTAPLHAAPPTGTDYHPSLDDDDLESTR